MFPFKYINLKKLLISALCFSFPWMIKYSCVRQCLYSISFNLTKTNKLFRFQFDRKCCMQRYCRRRRRSNRKIGKWDCAPACLFLCGWKRLYGSIGAVLISFSICQMRLPSRNCRKAVIYHLHLLRPPARRKGSLVSSLNLSLSADVCGYTDWDCIFHLHFRFQTSSCTPNLCPPTQLAQLKRRQAI